MDALCGNPPRVRSAVPRLDRAPRSRHLRRTPSVGRRVRQRTSPSASVLLRSARGDWYRSGPGRGDGGAEYGGSGQRSRRASGPDAATTPPGEHGVNLFDRGPASPPRTGLRLSSPGPALVTGRALRGLAVCARGQRMGSHFGRSDSLAHPAASARRGEWARMGSYPTALGGGAHGVRSGPLVAAPPRGATLRELPDRPRDIPVPRAPFHCVRPTASAGGPFSGPRGCGAVLRGSEPRAPVTPLASRQ